MFGGNPLAKRDAGDGSRLVVHSIFGTIQGEGPFAGRPAVFVRLAHCNLACFFCDTEFVEGAKSMALFEIMDEIKSWDIKTRLIVLTGGEPLRQQIGVLIDIAVAQGYHVQIETAGTVWPEGLEDHLHPFLTSVVCSPKTGRVHAMVEKHCLAWKYITAVDSNDPDDGLPRGSTQNAADRNLKIYRAQKGTIYLQPREEYRLRNGAFIPDAKRTRANVNLAVKLCVKHGYVISLQLHKILELP